jgi:hypothetical protein
MNEDTRLIAPGRVVYAERSSLSRSRGIHHDKLEYWKQVAGKGGKSNKTSLAYISMKKVRKGRGAYESAGAKRPGDGMA